MTISATFLKRAEIVNATLKRNTFKKPPKEITHAALALTCNALGQPLEFSSLAQAQHTSGWDNPFRHLFSIVGENQERIDEGLSDWNFARGPLENEGCVEHILQPTDEALKKETGTGLCLQDFMECDQYAIPSLFVTNIRVHAYPYLRPFWKRDANDPWLTAKDFNTTFTPLYHGLPREREANNLLNLLGNDAFRAAMQLRDRQCPYSFSDQSKIKPDEIIALFVERMDRWFAKDLWPQAQAAERDAVYKALTKWKIFYEEKNEFVEKAERDDHEQRFLALMQLYLQRAEQPTRDPKQALRANARHEERPSAG